MMKLFGIALETRKFYIAEVINGKEIRITTDFTFLADAESALRRMPRDNYVIKTA